MKAIVVLFVFVAIGSLTIFPVPVHADPEVVPTIWVIIPPPNHGNATVYGLLFFPLYSSAGDFGSLMYSVTSSNSSGSGGNIFLNSTSPKRGSAWMCAYDSNIYPWFNASNKIYVFPVLYLSECYGSATPIYYQVFQAVVPIQKGLNIITLQATGTESYGQYSTENYLVWGT